MVKHITQITLIKGERFTHPHSHEFELSWKLLWIFHFKLSLSTELIGHFNISVKYSNFRIGNSIY